jgi:dTDP-4-dehydrorhamnose reductase
VIVRPSLIWSLDPFDHQTRWLVEGVQNGQRVTLFTDEYRCPTYLHDLVAALLELAARPAITGVLNLTGPQALSRWDFGLKLLAALGLAPGPNVVPLTVRESGLARARNLTLLNARAQRELKTRLRSVDEILGYDVARKNTD